MNNIHGLTNKMISGDNRYDYDGTLVLHIRQIKIKLQKIVTL